MSEQKIFVNGIYAKRKTWPNGGASNKIWIPNVDEFCAWIQANKKPDGSIAWNVNGSREPRYDEKGDEKLNCELDTWVPNGGGQQAPQQQGFAQPVQQGVDPQFAPPMQPVQQQVQQQPMQQPQQYAQPQQPMQQPVQPQFPQQ